jgi:hypothetical protein
MKRWQWVLIALVAGFVIGSVRNMYGDEDLNNLGRSINTQSNFEYALLRPVAFPGGQQLPQFKDIAVVRVKDPANPSKLTYVVKVKYFPRGAPGGLSQSKDGKWHANYFPYFYIAKTPYVPEFPIKEPPATTRTLSNRLAALAERLRLKEPDPPNTVLDYLRRAESARGVKFVYQWWKQPRATIGMWVAICIVLIGGVWPTIASLIAFGTFFPPPEEKGVDLRKVRSTPTAEKKRAGVTDQDMERLLAMEADLEAKLKASGVATGAAGQPDKPPPTPVRELTAAPLDAAKLAQQAKEDKEFGAKPDDYYPTERHGRPKKPT